LIPGICRRLAGERDLVAEGKADRRYQPRARRRLLAIGGIGCRV
jgi:hypothetical protein